MSKRCLALLPPLLLSFSLLPSLVQAQPPQRPLQALDTWSLPGYHAVDPATQLQLPEGLVWERASSVVFTPEGNLLVLHRGPQPLLEFDAAGKFLRAFGEGIALVFAHGLDVDRDGNIWLTDLRTQLVLKLDRDGKLLMTLGTPNEGGLWDEAAGAKLFDQPNETALDSAGNLYVVQGHGQGEPRVLKFAPDGSFIKQWGSRGSEPGQFAVAHSIKIDANDRLYVADRENQRIQIFDTEGKFIEQWTYNAMVCALFLHDDGTFWMTSGFDGELAQIDGATGKLIGALGSPGAGIGQFGEAHFLTVDGEHNIFVADVVNKRVQIYARD
jgi:DNA-binding beta-propeller fold protein YncE